MAIIHVEIPDGEFCSDKHYLDCKFASHLDEIHYCHIYGRCLDKLEEVTVEGEKRKLRRKCKPCLKTLNGNLGPLAIEIDK